MICSTSYWQKGVRLLLLVTGAVLECFLVLFRAFRKKTCFMVYSVETVTETFWASSFLFFPFLSFIFYSPPPPPPPPVFLLLFCRKLWRFEFFKIIYYITVIIINVNADNDRFAVLCQRYFSVCDWRFLWCQFVVDLKENPGWFQSQLNIDGRMISQL